MKRLIKSFN